MNEKSCRLTHATIICEPALEMKPIQRNMSYAKYRTQYYIKEIRHAHIHKYIIIYIISSNTTIGCDCTLEPSVVFLAVEIKKFEVIKWLVQQRVVFVDELLGRMHRGFLHE